MIRTTGATVLFDPVGMQLVGLDLKLRADTLTEIAQSFESLMAGMPAEFNPQKSNVVASIRWAELGMSRSAGELTGRGAMIGEIDRMMAEGMQGLSSPSGTLTQAQLNESLQELQAGALAALATKGTSPDREIANGGDIEDIMARANVAMLLMASTQQQLDALLGQTGGNAVRALDTRNAADSLNYITIEEWRRAIEQFNTEGIDLLRMTANGNYQKATDLVSLKMNFDETSQASFDRAFNQRTGDDQYLDIEVFNRAANELGVRFDEDSSNGSASKVLEIYESNGGFNKWMTDAFQPALEDAYESENKPSGWGYLRPSNWGDAIGRGAELFDRSNIGSATFLGLVDPIGPVTNIAGHFVGGGVDGIISIGTTAIDFGRMQWNSSWAASESLVRGDWAGAQRANVESQMQMGQQLSEIWSGFFASVNDFATNWNTEDGWTNMFNQKAEYLGVFLPELVVAVLTDGATAPAAVQALMNVFRQARLAEFGGLTAARLALSEAGRLVMRDLLDAARTPISALGAQVTARFENLMQLAEGLGMRAEDLLRYLRDSFNGQGPNNLAFAEVGVGAGGLRAIDQRPPQELLNGRSETGRIRTFLDVWGEYRWEKLESEFARRRNPINPGVISVSQFANSRKWVRRIARAMRWGFAAAIVADYFNKKVGDEIEEGLSPVSPLGATTTVPNGIDPFTVPTTTTTIAPSDVPVSYSPETPVEKVTEAIQAITDIWNANVSIGQQAQSMQINIDQGVLSITEMPDGSEQLEIGLFMYSEDPNVTDSQLEQLASEWFGDQPFLHVGRPLLTAEQALQKYPNLR